MDENVNQVPQNQVVYDEGGRSPKKILSIVIGVVVVIVIILILIFFVLPMFRSKAPENATLVYWGVWEDKAIFDEVAADFTRENPNITIQFEKQDIKTLGKYIDRIKTRADNGTGPDVFRYHNTWTTQLRSILLPLPQDIVDANNLDANYYPVIESDLKGGGAYYGIPRHFDTLSLFINVDLVEAAGLTSYPTTWNDLITASKQLTVKNQDEEIITAGVALGTYDNIAHAPDIISLLLVQNGADLYNLGGPNIGNAVDALNFYTAFAQGDDKVWDNTMENSKLAFASGKLAMYFGYSWDIFEIQSMNPDLDFAIVNVPSLSGRNNTIASYWVEGVSNKSKYPDAALKFLEYLTSRSTMEKFYERQSQTRLFGELYPRSDMAELLSENAMIAPFVAQGPSARSSLFAADTYDEGMIDILNSYMGDAIRSMTESNTSAQTAIETLANGVAQEIAKYAPSGN